MQLRKRVAGLVAGLTMLAGVTVAVTITGLGTASAESNGGVKVMPLGDSITDGFNVPGGYRIQLWNRLVSGGQTVDFVGPQYNGPSTLGDHDHAGYTGWEISQIDAQVVGWMQTYQPHTIMLQIGSNDILHNIDWANAPTRLGTLLDHILTTLPQVELFVASITPLGGDYASYETGVQAYNASIPSVISARTAKGYQVHFVDMHSVLTTSDLADGIHPSASGYDKMGNAWYSALTSVPNALANGGSSASPTVSKTSASPTTPTSTTPASTAPASTAPATSSPASSSASGSGSGAKTCTAAYRVVGQWTGGFQGEVTVTAGSTAISGWTVTWTFGGGQTVTQSWNTTLTSSGSNVSATNVAYNGSLAAAGSAVFGFLGSYTSSNPTPTLACAAN